MTRYSLCLAAALMSLGIALTAQAQTKEVVLHAFTPGGPGGSLLQAGVTMDSAGNFYGTTVFGGSADLGVVYKLSPSGQETVLHNFVGGADGRSPVTGVTLDTAGNLYGTAPYGGAGYGVVYKLDSSGNETILYTFTGGADGARPESGLLLDSSGNLYGTTSYGGAAAAYRGYGVVYKLDSSGHQSVLYAFAGGADGRYPYAGVVQDAAGNFYGTTAGGGAFNSGTVYKLSAGGQESVLYSFTGGADGHQPFAGVILDGSGNLYGTTRYGGSAAGFAGQGTVFEVSAGGQETVLSTLGGAYGKNPQGSLILDAAGNLYGAAPNGGLTDGGVVYELSAAGQVTVLYNFGASGRGTAPLAGLLRDAAGHLYGTTSGSSGVVFELE